MSQVQGVHKRNQDNAWCRRRMIRRNHKSKKKDAPRLLFCRVVRRDSEDKRKKSRTIEGGVGKSYRERHRNRNPELGKIKNDLRIGREREKAKTGKDQKDPNFLRR